MYDLVRYLRINYPGEVFVFSPAKNISDSLHIEVFGGSHETLGKNITFSIRLALLLKTLISHL